MLNVQFVYQLIRTERRTLGLEIRETGELIVRAPHRLSQAKIDEFLREKERWILRHKDNIRKQALAHPPKQFLAGEEFLYLGLCYPLKTAIGPQSLFFDHSAFYMPACSQEKARQQFLKWYRQQAQLIISARVADYAVRHGLNYQAIRITSPHRRWGSCSPNNNLSFNWCLIMAPLAVIDYVVVHELAHTMHKNHGKRFWQKVAKIMPDYKIHRRWLSENGHKLTL